MNKLLATAIVLFCSSAMLAQGIQDSIFRIATVTVYSSHLFRKEGAGMKESRVDSLSLINRINLSLTDLLSESTSVYIKNQGRGALAAASFRGTAASHTQVLWNGININSPSTGMVDFSLIPVFFVDDMTLKHGPASIADNSGGLGGSISIGNSVNWNDSLAFIYSQGVGSYRTFDERLGVAYGNARVCGRTRLFHSYSANNYTFTNWRKPNIGDDGTLTFPLDVNKNADYTKYGLLQEVYWRAKPTGVFSVKYWGQRADRAIPTVISYEGDVNSNINNQDDTDHRLVAEWRSSSANGSLVARGGYARKNLGYVSKHLIAGAGVFPVVYSQSVQSTYLSSASYTYNFATGWSAQAGLSVNFHDVQSLDSVNKTGYSRSRFESSLFAAVRKSLFNRLNVNIMLRQDFVDGGFVPLIPFVGFDYRVIDGLPLVLKCNMALNYHQPTLNDLYWLPGGNPNLLPEDGFSVELGAEYEHTAQLVRLSSEITLYSSKINNWIIWLPNFKGYWEPMNVRRVQSRGLEYALKMRGGLGGVSYRLMGNFALSQSLNYGDRQVWGDDSYGKQLPFLPLLSGNMLVHVAYGGYYITYQHSSYSQRFTTTSAEPSAGNNLGAYFMNDLYAGKNFVVGRLNFNFELRVLNLFNEQYRSDISRPMPRRNYMAQLTLRI